MYTTHTVYTHSKALQKGSVLNMISGLIHRSATRCSLSGSLLRTVQPHMGLEVLSKDKWALWEERVGDEEQGPDPVPPPPRTFSISAISNCLNPSRNGLLTIAGTRSDSSSSRGLIPLTNDSFWRLFVWGIVKVVSFVWSDPRSSESCFVRSL
jgi:hypothetical protein